MKSLMSEPPLALCHNSTKHPTQEFLGKHTRHWPCLLLLNDLPDFQATGQNPLRFHYAASANQDTFLKTWWQTHACGIQFPSPGLGMKFSQKDHINWEPFKATKISLVCAYTTFLKEKENDLKHILSLRKTKQNCIPVSLEASFHTWGGAEMKYHLCGLSHCWLTTIAKPWVCLSISGVLQNLGSPFLYICFGVQRRELPGSDSLGYRSFQNV